MSKQPAWARSSGRLTRDIWPIFDAEAHAAEVKKAEQDAYVAKVRAESEAYRAARENEADEPMLKETFKSSDCRHESAVKDCEEPDQDSQICNMCGNEVDDIVDTVSDYASYIVVYEARPFTGLGVMTPSYMGQGTVFCTYGCLLEYRKRVEQALKEKGKVIPVVHTE